MNKKDLEINPFAHPEIQFVTTSPDHFSGISYNVNQEIKLKEDMHLRKPSDFVSEDNSLPIHKYFATELPSHSRILDIRKIFTEICQDLFILL